MSDDLRELNQDAEQNAAQLPRSPSRTRALESAINAAEVSMRSLKLAKDPNEKARHSARFKQLLQEAERIKHSKDWRQASHQRSAPSKTATIAPSSAHRDQNLREPHSQRPLSKSEQILLLKAGYLNGFKFPPWKSPPLSTEFDLKDGEDLFVYVHVRSF